MPSCIRRNTEDRLEQFFFLRHSRVQQVISVIVIAQLISAGSFASVQTYYGYVLDALYMHVLVLV